jgi:hypothetical protein
MTPYEQYQVLAKLGYHIDSRGPLYLATIDTYVLLGRFITFEKAVAACVEPETERRTNNG